MSYPQEKVDTKLDYWANRISILNQRKYKKVRGRVVESLDWVINNLVSIFCCSKSCVCKPKLGYKYFVRLPLIKGFHPQLVNNEIPHILLLVEPHDFTRPFMEIQFKGQPYNSSNWATARIILENIIGIKTYKEIFKHIKTVSLDVRVDVDEPLDNFIFDCLKTRTSATFFKSGLPKTFYFNSKRSPFHVGIYSRINKKTDKSLPDKGCFDTRIEMRQRELDLPISEVITEVRLVKEFKRFKVYDFKQMEGCEFLDFYFLLACKHVGLIPILKQLNKDDKRMRRKELERFEIIIVSQELIERQLQEYMNLASVLDPDNHDFEELLDAEYQKLKGLYVE